MTRNLSEEIKQLRLRKEFDTFWNAGESARNIYELIDSIKNLNSSQKDEILKLIPVKLVAAIESMLRSTITKLIDEKENCFENSKGLFQDSKFKMEFDYFKDLHRRKFSFGQFVSHQIRFNRLSNFDFALSTLILGKKSGFFDILNECSKSEFTENASTGVKYLYQDYNSIMASIEKIIELRHIICHETSSNLKINESDAKKYCKHVYIFLNEVYGYVSEYLYPDSPQTDDEMFNVASKEFNKKEEQLIALLQTAKLNETVYGTKVNNDYFDKAIGHWKQFRELYTEAVLFDMRDGQDYRIFRLQDINELTDDLISTLENEFGLNKEE